MSNQQHGVTSATAPTPPKATDPIRDLVVEIIIPLPEGTFAQASVISTAQPIVDKAVKDLIAGLDSEVKANTRTVKRITVPRQRKAAA